MFCSACRHNLRGAAGALCPECGRAFNPEDPASFLEARSRLSSSPPNRIGRIGWLVLVCSAAPWISIAALVLLWGFAWLLLGHPPTPSIDDPKGIGGPGFAWAYQATGFLLLPLFPAMGLAILMLGIQTGRALLDARRRRVWMVVAGASMGLLVSGRLILMTPWIQEIITWFFD